MSIDAIASEETIQTEFEGWSRQIYDGTVYFQSPDRRVIAWPVRDGHVRFTWSRSGKQGPNRGESIADYVNKRFHGKGDRYDVRIVAQILSDLERAYGKPQGYLGRR